MESVYLPIRSFGDFIITASVVKENFKELVPVVTPPYLSDIFDAIQGSRYFKVLGNIDFNNQPAFFEMYKVRDVANAKRLLNDIKTITTSLNKQQTYLLDYSSKRLAFSGQKFLWPNKQDNIYEGKKRMLTEAGLIQTSSDEVKLTHISPIKKVIILPDSRIASKSISQELTKQLLNSLNNVCRADVAIFKKGSPVSNGILTYGDFDTLIGLLASYDLVISAESLPYHLANFLNKPHFVIYNQSRHFKATFMTPHMCQHEHYAKYTGNNAQDVIGRILNIVSRQTNN